MTSTPHIDSWMDGMPHGAGHLNEHMGFTLLEASADRVVGTIPVEPNTQPMGLLHGGASAALVETLGSVGSFIHAQSQGKWAVGVEINATHHRSGVVGETITGVATAVHLGRQFATYEAVLTNDAGKRVCTGRITCAIIDPR